VLDLASLAVEWLSVLDLAWLAVEWLSVLDLARLALRPFHEHPRPSAKRT
jgi:hypothetical protein